MYIQENVSKLDLLAMFLIHKNKIAKHDHSGTFLLFDETEIGKLHQFIILPFNILHVIYEEKLEIEPLRFQLLYCSHIKDFNMRLIRKQFN